jgi:NAD-dependent deacetylase
MYNSIVVLTGAGISAESGIRTFRASDGLWEEHRVEDVATPEGYIRDPKLVHRFYNERLAHLESGVKPNLAHLALARLEKELDGQVLVVTQNIDNLHERAGTESLIHMHGELLKARCPATEQVFPLDKPFALDNVCTCCVPGEVLRPHIVWFGEMPLDMDRIYQALAACELFISIGTSGNVYPAAGFVEVARQSGAETIEINLEPSNVHTHFHHHQHGKAGDLVPELVDWLLDGNRF